MKKLSKTTRAHAQTFKYSAVAVAVLGLAQIAHAQTAAADSGELVVTGFRAALEGARTDISYRLLLSAHGLPKKVIRKGDPYQRQVEQTAAAIVAALDMPGLDSQVCYQSRVGPLEWIGPSTDDEIRRAGKDGKGVIIAPVAFVSEHSETLVELDIEYRKLAEEAGVPDYRRAATAGVQSDFIGGLAGLVRRALVTDIVAPTPGGCATGLCGCRKS